MVFTAVIGLLNLAIPLGTQAMVQTISSGMLRQPVVVITGLVFLALVGVAALQMGQLKIIERFQQRVFANSALKVAERMTSVKMSEFRGEYAPELVNRFFDVLTIQKALAKLLADGYASLLQATVGMIVLAFYSPILVILDAGFVVLITGLTLFLGLGGLKSSIRESASKYRVASWIEDMARCTVSLKMHGNSSWLKRKADVLIAEYLKNRESHFKVVYRQAIGLQVLEAFAQSLVLAVGGWLVLNGQLNLGQLVASQLVVAGVLKASEKLVLQADQFFDLLTGLDKVGHVTDLASERVGGTLLPEYVDPRGAKLVVENVGFSYDSQSKVLQNVSLSVEPGENVSLVGASGAGKSTLASIICGLEDPSHGTVLIDDREIRSVDLTSLRRDIALVGYDNELFEGTIEENILIGRPWVTQEDLRWALKMSELNNDLARMSNGAATHVVSGGRNLSRGQVQRILIARAIVGRPRLLILDEAFTGIDERQTSLILDNLFDRSNGWTILDISHMGEVVVRSDHIYLLEDGEIVDCGTPNDLARKDGPFAKLFPYLCGLLRTGSFIGSNKEPNDG